MEIIQAKTKAEIEGIKEVLDFIDNGYMLLFSGGESGHMFLKLKHYRNGRIISVKITYTYYQISSRGKILKTKFVPYQLISD